MAGYGTPSEACACKAFTPQIYRPGLCALCFASIAEHFEEWEVVPDTKPPVYVNTKNPSETLGGRINERDMQLFLGKLREKRQAGLLSRSSSRHILSGTAQSGIEAWNERARAASDAAQPPAMTRHLAPSIVHAAGAGETAGGGASAPDALPSPSEGEECAREAPTSHVDVAVQGSVAPPPAPAAQEPATELAPVAPTMAPIQAPSAHSIREDAPAALVAFATGAMPVPASTVPVQVAPKAAGGRDEVEPGTISPSPAAVPDRPAEALESPTTVVTQPISDSAPGPPPAAAAAPTDTATQRGPASSPPRASSGAQPSAAEPAPAPAGSADPVATETVQETPASTLTPEQEAASVWMQVHHAHLGVLPLRSWAEVDLPRFAAGQHTVTASDGCPHFQIWQCAMEEGGQVDVQHMRPRVLRVSPVSVLSAAWQEQRPSRGWVQWERSLAALTYVGVQPWSSLVSPQAIGRLRSLSQGAGAATPPPPVQAAGASGGEDSMGVVLCFRSDARTDSFTRVKRTGDTAAPVEGEALMTGVLWKHKEYAEGTWKKRASGLVGAIVGRPRRGSLTQGGKEDPGFGWKKRWMVLRSDELLYFTGQEEAAAAQAAAAAAAEAAASGDLVEAERLGSDAEEPVKGRISLSSFVEVAPYFPEGEEAPLDGAGLPTSASCLLRTASTCHQLRASSPAEAQAWMRAIMRVVAFKAARLPMYVQLLKCASPQQAASVAESVSTARAAMPDLAVLDSLRGAPLAEVQSTPLPSAQAGTDTGGSPPDLLTFMRDTGLDEATARALLADGAGGGSVVGHDGQYDAERVAWCYVDDADVMQGPYLEAQMRAWVGEGWFKESTMVRCASRVLGVDYDATAGQGGAAGQCMLMSVGDLFPDGLDTAFDGSGSWISAYNLSAQYQRLVAVAVSLGCSGPSVMAGLHLMQESTLPPDLGLLMDMMRQGEGAPPTEGAAQ